MSEEFLDQHFYTPSAEFLNSSLYITWAGHRRCSAKHIIGPRMLETYKLVFVLGGKGYLEQGESPRCQLSAEDVFVLFPRTRHCYFADPDDPWELMWVAFNGELCQALLEPTGLSLNNCVLKKALTVGIEKTMTTIIDALGDPEDVNRLRAIGYFYVLLTKLARESRSNQQIVQEQAQESVVSQVISFIEQNYYNPIDVELLCKHVNYSRSFLSHAFKAETGMTIPELINKVRVKKAKLLLLETSLAIKEVACSVGVMDCFYFSKIFKAHTGVSPLIFRKENSQKSLER